MSETETEYTTRCGCCKEPIRYVKVFDGNEYVWIDRWDRNGCPDPLQPNAGLFPHDPIDATPEWALGEIVDTVTE